MRRSFDGLVHLAEQVIQEDPFSGHLFVFFNRRSDRVKILYWDRSGPAIWYNQLASHYTSSGSMRAGWDSSPWFAIIAARSTSRFHRLHCFIGGFGPGISYRR
jgi:hypothetical protein